MNRPTLSLLRCLPVVLGLSSVVPAWGQAPVITRFEPHYGTVGDPQPVSIYVQNVARHTDIRELFFNTTPQPLFSVPAFNGEWGWEVRANVPAGATTGPITVRNAQGAAGSSLANFLVFGPGPRPLSFTPASGRTNALVTITGDRFITGTRVYFKSATGEIEAVVQGSTAQNQVFATVPNNAVTGKLRVASSAGSNETVDPFTVIQDVDVRVRLHAEPATGVIGQALTLVTTVTNASAFPATGVIVTNGLHASLSYVSGSTSTGGTVGAPVNGVTTAIIGTLAARQSVEVRLIVQPTQAGQVNTTAGAHGNEPDPDGTSNARTLQTTIITSNNDLALGMTATAPVYVNEPMTYTIVVTNRGPLVATGVQVVNTLPDQVEPLTVTTSQGTSQTAGQRITALLGMLPVGGTADVRITVKVLTVDPFVNVASVTAAEPDPSPGNNSASVQTAPRMRSADLGVTQTISPNPPRIGQTNEYRVLVTNHGPESAGQVQAVNVLSTNVLFVLATPTQGTVERTADVLTAHFGTLESGASATLTIRVVHRSAAATTNQVEVASLEVSDANPANNRSLAAWTPVAAPVTLGHQFTNQLLVLTWPAFPNGWKLQVRSTFQTNSIWMDDENPPEVSGSTKRVEIDPATLEQGQSFYRLRFP